jgi:NADP-dependent 3-hydroxy acid dehydrogenase YdfG
MNRYRKSTAIVTGAASGIGFALAAELYRLGARVALADVDTAALHTAVEQLGAAPSRIITATVDVSDEGQVRALVDGVLRRWGRLDFLFNNAGISIGGEAQYLTAEHWSRVVAVNLWGVVNGVLAAYPVMVNQRSGHIVNTASIAGLANFPTATPYATTKHAVVGLSLSLRAEAEHYGVRVSVLCPGVVASRIFERAVYVNTTASAMLAQMPFAPIDAQKAARQSLRGVARNRAVIVFPSYARVVWWLARISPGLLAVLNRVALRAFWARQRGP